MKPVAIADIFKSKRTYVPVEDDTESPQQKRDRLYERLHKYIPNAVGVLYWKEEKKQRAMAKAMQDTDKNEEISK